MNWTTESSARLRDEENAPVVSRLVSARLRAARLLNFNVPLLESGLKRIVS